MQIELKENVPVLEPNVLFMLAQENEEWEKVIFPFIQAMYAKGATSALAGIDFTFDSTNPLVTDASNMLFNRSKHINTSSFRKFGFLSVTSVTSVKTQGISTKIMGNKNPRVTHEKSPLRPVFMRVVTHVTEKIRRTKAVEVGGSVQARSYSEKPISWIWPLCVSPSSSPAPRISRSWVASVKPEPRSSSESMASRRLIASAVITAFGGAMRYA